MAPRRSNRIAVVAASLDILGGQGVQAALLVRALRGEGYDVTFVPINPRLVPGLGWLRRVRVARTLANQCVYLPGLLRLAQTDVVHVFSASYWSFLLAPVPAMLAARAFGKRVVLHYHSGEAEDHLANWGKRVHPWLRLADEIVVPSAYLMNVFVRHGYAARVIPNVVDLSRFRYRGRRPLKPRFISTRNLEPYYDVATTLRAFALLKVRFPEATLVVAGAGSEEPRLREVAASLAVDGVRFVGPVQPEAMPGLCDDADIFINASVVDNQPVSILEAFASGLVVVSTPTGAIPEMVRHGQNGLLVSPRNPPDIARAVTSLLECPDQAFRMTERAREEMTKYTWPAVSTAWALAYGQDGQP